MYIIAIKPLRKSRNISLYELSNLTGISRTYLRNLETRKQEVVNSIDGQGKLTDEIVIALEIAKTLAEVEDIYRPYKQKKRTRATIAK